MEAVTRQPPAPSRAAALQSRVASQSAAARSRRTALSLAGAALLWQGPALAASGVVELTPDNFDSVVKSSNRVFLEAYAPWCPYCKQMEPAMQRLPAALRGAGRPDVVVARMNVDEHTAYAQRFGVSAFPTLLLLLDGEVVGQHAGLVAEETLLRFALAKPGPQEAEPQEAAALDLVLTPRAQGALRQELRELRAELERTLPAGSPALARVDTISSIVTARLL